MVSEEQGKWDVLRQKAETILANQSGNAAVVTQEDSLHLIHELEVHQIELELQGEELRQKNLELKHLTHKFSDLYQQAPVGFVSLSTKGTISECNNRAVQMLSLSLLKLRARAFSHFIHIEDHKKYYKILDKLNHIPRGDAHGEVRMRRADGTYFFAEINVVPFKNGNDEVLGWIVSIVDITSRKDAEKNLREAYKKLEVSEKQLKVLSARVLSAQEEERKRIAAELHDSFGQTLAAMKYNIENVLESSADNNSKEAIHVLAHLVPTLQGAIEEVRSIYTGLRPTILDDFGIVAAIGWFCKQVGLAYPKIHFEMTIRIEEEDVPEQLRIVIFRIIQEAVNNVTKHSGAEWVDVSLARYADTIELIVEDNGVGFDVESAAVQKDRRGIGLGSMKERAEFSGGVLTIHSVTGEGTQLLARWKVSQ